MRLPKPSAPFSPVPLRGESVTIETEGKTLVIPTGNHDILSNLNEYTLSRSGEVLEIGTYTLTDAELQYMIKPWIALYDPAKTVLNFFLFTHKPKKLQYKISNVVINSAQFQTADGVNFVTADETNFLVNVTDKYITQLILFPGNGLIYYGQITHCDLTRDTNSDSIPDCIGCGEKRFTTADGKYFTTPYLDYFEVGIPNDGSLYKFLQSYGMVI
ncbi:MAG: hypothetical protein GX663_11565 [Clostridiales bacterium]|nr:hypothetical protein [Clostridiales bacterium]